MTASTTRVVGCPGSDPTFYIQFQDGNPARQDDEYTGQYLSVAPDTYRNTSQGYIVDTTASLSSAKLLTLQCSTGRLKTVAEGWFAEAEYFLTLTPVYFDTSAFIEQNEFQYLECGATAGVLSCYVQYPDPEFFVGRSIMQTCPEYTEVYKSPVALGNKEYIGGPDCFTKRMVIISV